MSPGSVGCPDGEGKFPMIHQHGKRIHDAPRWVIGTGWFSCNPVEFDDAEGPSFTQIFRGGVSDIIATDEKTIQATRDDIDPLLQSRAVEMHSVPENASLGMVSRMNKSD